MKQPLVFCGVLQTVKFSDILKIVGGFIAAILFFASPLSERVMSWIYREGVAVEYHNVRTRDPDQVFQPRITLTPSRDRGVSAGVIEWEFHEIAKKDRTLLDTQVQEFGELQSKSVFVAPRPVEFNSDRESFEVEVTVSVNSRFSDFGKFPQVFHVERDPKRVGISARNFTGTWHVQFGATKGIGELIVDEGLGRQYNGTFVVPDEVGEIGTLEISGRRDGGSFWMDDATNASGYGLSDSPVKFNLKQVDGVATIQGEVEFCQMCGTAESISVWSGEIWAYSRLIQ